MPANGIIARWRSYAPYLGSLLRIVAAFLFLLAGASKIFAWPAGMPPDGATATFPSQVWLGGWMEILGGVLL